MNVRNVITGSALSVALIATAAAQISASKHPHLAEAQRSVDQALHAISDAQAANDFDLGGHAQKAKGLLEQANQELKQAAMQSNANHR
jgi:hypothetical protein